MIWLTLAILFCYLLILKIINKESFFFTPIGVHAGFLAFGVVIPAVYVYRYEPVFEAGLLYLSANSRLLLCLNLALICLILGAVTASGWGSSLVARTPLGDDVRLGKVWVVLAAAAGLTALFFYSNAELYGTLLTQIWDTTDVFSLVQSTRVAALYGSTYAIQGVTRIAPVVILLLLAKWYTGSSRGARRLALVLVGLDFICLFLVGIRATQICVLLQLGLMRNYFKPFRSFRIVLYAAAICALLVAGTALKFGFGFSQSEILFSEVLTHAAERVSLGAKHLQYILALFPGETNHRLGMTYLQDAVSLIPSPLKRNFFPQNYWVDFNGYLYQRLYSHEGGTTTDTIFGEFYANFGFAGVVLGSFLYSFALQRLSMAFTQQKWRQSSKIAMAIFLSYYLAQSTIEGVGETFFVAALWAALLYAFLFPGRVLQGLSLIPARQRPEVGIGYA
ncbi:MAG: hypothetical protein DMG89_07140 [Acidobacteria bacterium]|nr:MAG: hypothetical protein DMG89_07140 [Acidobacteriota bacterium]